ncbi:hypothetical protein DPMN_072968 [Dreissena polymorpha]|uniref:Uncharacterized protein n=1 Tax=Dreissena polymorpha TaxID=45954 RepID=A0A9D4BYA5_DREPO|nr:hypothetical protein DPMN_072968 [Dreissena polymorpha]
MYRDYFFVSLTGKNLTITIPKVDREASDKTENDLYNVLPTDRIFQVVVAHKYDSVERNFTVTGEKVDPPRLCCLLNIARLCCLFNVVRLYFLLEVAGFCCLLNIARVAVLLNIEGGTPPKISIPQGNNWPKPLVYIRTGQNRTFSCAATGSAPLNILSNFLSDLRLICCTKYVLGFRQQDGSSVHKTIRLPGKDLHILTPPGNAGTEEQDQKHCQKRS